MPAWKIPKMTDPLGKYWSQPKYLRERVGLHPTHATIAERDWRALCNYESSIPSGVYPGKVWRRRHLLCWFGPEIGGRCKIICLRALIQ